MSSHRRNGAFSHTIDMVWLYRSPIPVGRRGVFGDYLPSRRLNKGGGEGSQLVFTPIPLFTSVISLKNTVLTDKVSFKFLNKWRKMVAGTR